MSDNQEEQRPLLSVLDRLLLGTEITSLRDSQSYTIDHLRRAVGRDLEMLLNTRQSCFELPKGLDELPLSLVNYGVPDFAGASIASETEREALRAEVEASIRRFEPRFREVHVTLVHDDDSLERTVRLRIDAVIAAEPVPELVAYDSLLEPVTRTFTVRSVMDV